MSGILPYLADSLLYALVGTLAWRRRAHAPQPDAADLPPGLSWEHFALSVPLALHGYLFYRATFGADGLYLGVGTAVSLIVLLAVLIYWLGNFFYRLEGMLPMVIPIAAISCLLPLAFPAQHPLPHTEAPAFKAHLLIAMLAYGLFTIASLHVLLMTLVERRLHGGPMPLVLRNLPPLLTMEMLLFRIITVGFLLLTATLVTGVLFSEEVFGKPFQVSHKTVFAFISWGIFAALLGGRHIYGWRGRIALRWTLAGFAALVLAYIGSKFVLEVILHR